MKSSTYFKTFKALLALGILFAGLRASAFDNTGLDSILSGKANYYCVLNAASPNEKDVYDQTIFAGGAFIGTNSEVVFVTPSGKFLATPLDKVTLDLAKELKGSTMAVMSLTDKSEVDSDLDRNINIGLSTFNPQLSQKAGDEDVASDFNPVISDQVVASGYHKAGVMLVDQKRKLNLSCWHKSRLFHNQK